MMQILPSEIFDNLAAHETNGVIELLHCALLAEGKEDFEKFLIVLQRVFGFQHILGGMINIEEVGGIPILQWDLSKVRHCLVNVGFPNEWLQEYCNGSYYRYDKVMHLLLRGHFANTWDELYADCTTACERMVFDGARTYGAYHGISVGRSRKELGWALFISCTGCSDGDAKRLLPIVDYVLSVSLSNFINVIAADLKGAEQHSEIELSGTSRAREIAYWVCEGKTNPEISKILGIRERTVRYHLALLFEKYQVHNRSRLVKELLIRSDFPPISQTPPYVGG